jgi:hypothetical protein
MSKRLLRLGFLLLRTRKNEISNVEYHGSKVPEIEFNIPKSFFNILI